LVGAGVDPWTFDPSRSGELEAERQRLEEEDAKTKADIAMVEEERRRVSVANQGGSGERREEAPKVFQLETFDNDSDSD
jgi:hypothetical protein